MICDLIERDDYEQLHIDQDLGLGMMLWQTHFRNARRRAAAFRPPSDPGLMPLASRETVDMGQCSIFVASSIMRGH
jgi:hypothetical protein